MTLLKSHANEETSSAGNVQMKGRNLKRRRSDSNCHQCHRNDKQAVVRCSKCSLKYCIPCIAKWYTRLEETDFAEVCAVCRNICNCAACLKSDAANKDLLMPDLKLSTTEKIQQLKDILRVLLPFLKQFIVEENMEREAEARIQGLPTTGLQLFKSTLACNDQMQCNNCKTSIFDIHRSCPTCSYKLCVTCCQEIRDGFPTAKHQYPIVCPPESMGGCGRRNLELKSSYPDNWVSELLRKAETVAEAGKVTDALEASQGASSCLRSHQEIELECAALLASREECNDNLLHCPKVLKIEKNDIKHFQLHLRKGEPAIVPNVLSGTTGLSWEPLAMWRACRKTRKADHFYIQDSRVLNSSNSCEETVNMHHFFKGYVEGLFDNEGQLKILKLEDWPPAESFQERLPRHFWEFIRCLPFRHYTHPHSCYLNMPANVHDISLKPDLGPKMCICYGVSQELGFGSVTKTHYALSDRVNILMHTAAISLSPERLSTIEKLRRAHVAQDPVFFSIGNERVIDEAMKNQHHQMENENKGQKECDPSTSRSRVEGLEDPEGGAIWDIFRRQDVPKLEEYLRKHAGEFTDISLLQQLVHPLHEKAFYLTMERKRNLKEEYGIEPWTFVQRLGDAVFVPAGCPHQIRNLKSCTSVAVDFVSPESVGECVRLSTEYRSLPHNHRCKEDKLQVKKMTLHAVSQAVQYLDMITLNTSRNPGTPPLIRTYTQNEAGLAFLKQEMEANKSMLEKQGHLLQPDMRAHLQREIQDYLDKIGSMIGSSSSQ